MKRAYDELMDRVTVTQEMRSRILDHLHQASLAPNAKVIRFPSMKKYLSLAACFAVLLTGAVALVRLLPNQPETNPGVVQSGSGIAEAASVQELSQLVGFEVTDIPDLPFDVEQVSYTVLWEKLAQITYTGMEQTLTFRKSAGQEDNSGDYTVYQNVQEKTVGGNSVTLKGDGNTYCLVVWTDGEFAYSLRFGTGVSESECMRIYAQAE